MTRSLIAAACAVLLAFGIGFAHSQVDSGTWNGSHSTSPPSFSKRSTWQRPISQRGKMGYLSVAPSAAHQHRAERTRSTKRTDLARAVRYVEALALNRYLNAIAQQARHPRVRSDHTGGVPATGEDYTTWPDWALWKCTAYHESGGLFWTNIAGPFRGAFDIALSTWQAYARSPYSAPNLAPPADQIIGARNVRAAVGSSKWGGLRVCGG